MLKTIADWHRWLLRRDSIGEYDAMVQCIQRGIEGGGEYGYPIIVTTANSTRHARRHRHDGSRQTSQRKKDAGAGCPLLALPDAAALLEAPVQRMADRWPA